MAASSLRHNKERSIVRVSPKVRGVEVRGGRMEVYKVSFTWILKLVDCPGFLPWPGIPPPGIPPTLGSK